MKTKRLIILIIAVFILGNMMLVYVKYNTDSSVDRLIGENQNLLNEFKVSNKIKALESDVVLIESKVSGALATNDPAYMNGLEMKIAKIQADLKKLQTIADDDSAETYIDQLDELVQTKIGLCRQASDTFNGKGKAAAEEIISTQRSKELTDSILILTMRINGIRQNRLQHITDAIDKSSKQVQRLNSFLTLLVLVAAALLFWYIINNIRKQNRLVQQVISSEQKAKAAAQVKENFLANMSHEIRTPMNAILGFTELLAQKKLDAEAGHYVETIHKSGENLLAIVNDILDISKIEAGMMRIESSPFNLRGLVQSVEIMLTSKAREKGIELASEIDDRLPDVLEGDPTRLRQILVNLISNAIKFTNAGAVKIEFAEEGRQGEIIRLGIAVKDSGIGINSEKLEHIFGRFQQAEEGITRQYGGTGLGLSIVKNLVELQGGNIRVESQPGKGTCFYLAMPYRIGKEQNPAPLATPQLQQVAVCPVSVLVVEDNEINQNLLGHIFKNWGWKYAFVNNGAEAIAQLKEGAFDLVLMDIQMPLMDGYSTARHIRQELKSDVPIVAMTAYAMPGEREKCLRCGMNEYIAKPVRQEQLRQLLAPFIPVSTTLQKAKDNRTNSHSSYSAINLQYLKEVSGGNKAYEKEVTEQFIQLFPVQLAALEKAEATGDTAQRKHIAHNLKTTLSVMGLNESLDHCLDLLENEQAEQEDILQAMQTIRQTGNAAIPEATDFLRSLA